MKKKKEKSGSWSGKSVEQKSTKCVIKRKSYMLTVILFGWNSGIYGGRAKCAIRPDCHPDSLDRFVNYHLPSSSFFKRKLSKFSLRTIEWFFEIESWILNIFFSFAANMWKQSMKSIATIVSEKMNLSKKEWVSDNTRAYILRLSIRSLSHVLVQFLRFVSLKVTWKYGKVPGRRRYSRKTDGRRSGYNSSRRISAGRTTKYQKYIRRSSAQGEKGQRWSTKNQYVGWVWCECCASEDSQTESNTKFDANTEESLWKHQHHHTDNIECESNTGFGRGCSWLR